MFEQIIDLEKNVSDKLLIGTITFTNLLGNPSLALAQGTNGTSDSSLNNLLFGVGLAGGCLLNSSGEVNEKRRARKYGRLFTSK